MSGHNKWSKIKHKKAAGDAKKSKIFSKYARLITLEAKKANGDKNAPGVLAVIERARKESMPNDNIDRAIQKAAGGGADSMEEVLYETFGPGGTALVITAVTDNSNRTTPEIRHILSKAGYQLGAAGSALWAFTKTTDGYVPTAPLDLADEDGEKLATLVEALEEQDDVQDIYTTADTPDA
ncbi:YebC/PmpR family DNA-binding transcriptional regulator [Candidatus Kaiserbacteria bacterium]|nr:YebC/PmpR family DNA-binding transcriptional regulator [Candidatus Kaiserbacteria bacterium]